MTATLTASQLEPNQPVAWGSLERSAFEDFPEVVDALRGAGLNSRANRKLIFLVPLSLLIAIIYAAPVWGVATVVGPWGLSQTIRTAQGDITAAGIIFGIALAAILVQGGIWLVTRRPKHSALLGSSSMTLLLGALSAGVAAKRGVENSVPDWGLWVLPMIGCVLVGGVFFFLVLRVNRTASVNVNVPAQQDFRATEAYAGPVRASIARVSDADQSVVRSDLVAAINDLERRHVITSVQAVQARSAQLGSLAAQMSRSLLAQ